ncbi:MAG: tetratricopeptide repeat protein [Deltaproteobacteria bacterium]
MFSKSCIISFSCLLLTACCLLSLGCSRQIIIIKDPLKAEEHARLAQIYEAKGEIELAVEEYKKALEQDKTNPMAYFGLGNISFKQGRHTDAEDYYKKAIENTSPDDQKNAMLYNNLSWVYIETNKKLAEAETLTQKAVRLDTARVYIYLDTLGVIYTRLNEYEKAEDSLLTALKNAPYEKTALRHINIHLFELYEIKGDRYKLQEVIERLRGLGK